MVEVEPPAGKKCTSVEVLVTTADDAVSMERARGLTSERTVAVALSTSDGGQPDEGGGSREGGTHVDSGRAVMGVGSEDMREGVQR